MESLGYIIDSFYIKEIGYFIGTFLFMWGFYLMVKTEKSQEHTQYRNDINQTLKHSFCINPSCVRCSLYTKAIAEANCRLKTVCEKGNQSEVAIAEKITQFLKNTSLSSESFQKPNVLYLNILQSRPLWEGMDILTGLEYKFNIIKNEFKIVYDNHVDRWRNNVTAHGKWSIFSIINQGRTLTENITLCPNTFKIISSLPNLMQKNVFGNVAFSVVEPGTHIFPHYGPTNIRLRCHLGLITPKTCYMKVAEEIVTWEDGKCLVFDDSYLHSVEHAGTEEDGIRAILMIDLWHPDITEEEQQILDMAFAPL
ncbi:hypothetical protein CHS0354_025165 [Potamilus streckersoni]|uniref:Aspartyl/asparaginy/proline hydroxylase domain-containing protein n=1 Tax=Potamilus streckersoni TaxID=2493646 RepID=A0AAE0RWI4_9BIVA|nr:hypothetical protein CHS0354_025165 [Potamilus streckersoni]